MIELNETAEWKTFNGHPATWTEYQEAFTSQHGTVARVIVAGREVVSPSTDLNSVYRQYNRRVRNYIESHED